MELDGLMKNTLGSGRLSVGQRRTGTVAGVIAPNGASCHFAVPVRIHA